VNARILLKGLVPVTVAILLLTTVGCQSVPEEIPEGLSQAELVQRAQDAADVSNWDAAILYYQTILERFPEERAARMEARYEVAFITYRRGEPQLALRLFQEILRDYEEDGEGLPDWPRVLSEVLIEKINAETE